MIGILTSALKLHAHVKRHGQTRLAKTLSLKLNDLMGNFKRDIKKVQNIISSGSQDQDVPIDGVPLGL